MFTQQAVTTIYKNNRDMLNDMLKLEAALLGRFYGMEGAVRCMMLSAITGEAMVMIGPPGTAKSRLIRAFCSMIGVLDHDPRDEETGTDAGAGKDERYFEYLLTQFTEPSELFGYFDLSKLMDAKDPRLERNVAGQMQRAEVVFLDEVFNASSAILNALLTFMNERKFHDRGMVYQTPLKMLFGATNHPPQEEGLGAVYDRFLLRCRMENASARHEDVAKLLSAAWTETHSHAGAEHGEFRTLPDKLQTYREAIETMTTDGKLSVDPMGQALPHLAALVASVRSKELSEMSNRRLVKFSAIVLAEALLRSAGAGASSAEILPRDLGVILTYGLDQDDPGTVAKLRQDLLLG